MPLIETMAALRFGSGAVAPENTKAYLFTRLGVSTITIEATGVYRVYLIAGGGAGALGYGGNGGVVRVDVPLVAGETLEVGVGGGGNLDGHKTPSSYALRGGDGVASAGAGGDGSYIKAAVNVGRPNYSGYLAIAGGGGGSAVHAYEANLGGHGYGVGGATWSVNWADTPSPAYSGRSAYNATNPGAAGAGQSNGYPGGSANIEGKLTGANGAVASASATHGGAGGGGAGGGAGGAGGGPTGAAGNPGGKITVTYSVAYATGGGGGGGGHANACGGCGAGGGILAFTGYSPAIEAWSSTSIRPTSGQLYNEFRNLVVRGQNISNLVSTALALGGQPDARVGGDGAVLIVPTFGTPSAFSVIS
ncbi:hypothetical protein [Massilia sp. TN1-12]|uniref:hypothetical protein n=1 Tax=Massilia paldalensis TaxID=3377675 RepID=UPI00384A70E4